MQRLGYKKSKISLTFIYKLKKQKQKQTKKKHDITIFLPQNFAPSGYPGQTAGATESRRR